MSGNCLFWGETQLPDNNFGRSNSSVDCSPLMFFCSVADIENWVHTMMEFWDCLYLNPQIWPPLVASFLNFSNGGGNCLFCGETQLPDNNFGQSSSVDSVVS